MIADDRSGQIAVLFETTARGRALTIRCRKKWNSVDRSYRAIASGNEFDQVDPVIDLMSQASIGRQGLCQQPASAADSVANSLGCPRQRGEEVGSNVHP